MRKQRLTEDGADLANAEGAQSRTRVSILVDALKAFIPGNKLAILGIIAAFGLLVAYEQAWMAQSAAEKQQMALELAQLKSAAVAVTPADNGATFAVASEAPIPVEALGGSQSPAVPHFAVLFGVLSIVLTLAWQRRKKPMALMPARIDTNAEPDGVFDALNLGVAQWDAAGTMVGCNARFKSLFGDVTEAALGDLAHKAMMAALSRNGDVSLVQDDEHRRVVEIIAETGHALVIEERPLKSGGFVTLISDNSVARQAAQALNDLREEQKLMAQQLREEKFRAEAASRAKTSFLAHLSHDVRTPLNHIIGFADLIAHQTYGPIGDKRYLNYVNDIKGSGEKLLSSFSEILELAQIEGGQLVLRRERLGVTDLLNTTANRFQDAAKRAGLSFETSIPDEGLLYGDRFCLERMVSNLVDNAIQFTPNGGAVRLAAYLAEDGVVIEVSDTGIGMSEERLKDLSQPFVLGDAAFTRETSGVGLGISISRAIAELSGGQMEIDSHPAVGTTVAISLPLHAAKAEEKAA